MIGPDVVIEDGVCMSKTTVLRGARVKSHAWIQQSIVGWESTVGKWVSIMYCMEFCHSICLSVENPLAYTCTCTCVCINVQKFILLPV